MITNSLMIRYVCHLVITIHTCFFFMYSRSQVIEVATSFESVEKNSNEFQGHFVPHSEILAEFKESQSVSHKPCHWCNQAGHLHVPTCSMCCAKN